MLQLLQYFLWVPLAGFIFCLLISRKNERAISGLAIAITGLHLIGVIAFTIYWFINNHPTLDVKHLVIYQTHNIEIFIALYFDITTVVFALIGSLLTFLVIVFSKYYLHRDEGFKRYFCILLLFFFGYNIILFSGNFETLFTGWEILGVCSFLLIAFYRNRYLPVKNSLKIISLYRVGDVCLILAMWMSHHLWHENITFAKINDFQSVKVHIDEHQWYAFFIALMFIFAAVVKSAQIPFSTWLPRAMEGPTTSSAIFYGSLSVHLGAFLLLRTHNYWESMLSIKIAVIAIGFISFLIASSIAKVQSSVKVQIAYMSIAQIGLIFIEIALGFHYLALFHFSANALLRTYQLLVSPSVLSYLTHDMFFNFNFNKTVGVNSKIKNTFYMLSIKEWNIDSFFYTNLWRPFKSIGLKLKVFRTVFFLILFALLFLSGLYCYYFQENISYNVLEYSPYAFSVSGFLLILKAFADRGDALWTWSFCFLGQLFITLSIALLNDVFDHEHMLIYLGGTTAAFITGLICLSKIKKIDQDIQLNRFHGYVYEKPVIASVFLVACLCFIGLPLTPTYIGIDLLFSHVHRHEILVIIFTSLSFIFIEIAVLRIYARIFLGPYKKPNHAMAYKSS